MSGYRVNLDIFAGPLDLLLHLVRKDEMDIYDIHIAEITDQYIRYIEILKNLDIDLAGDFLVMAATLMQIKSAMLLPKTEAEELDGEDLADPRAELIRQLLEYKKYKDAANLLSAAAEEQKQRFSRPGAIVERLRPDAEPAIDIEQISVWDLLEAFDSIMTATSGMSLDISHIADDTPIDLYQIEILHRLQSEGAMLFKQLFDSRTNRVVMVGLFLALLELVREKLVRVKQRSTSGGLYLQPLTDEPPEEAVQKAIIAAAEAEKEQLSQRQSHQKPAVPISELPAKSKTEAAQEALRQEQSAVPIAELPQKNKSEFPQSQDNKESAENL